MQLRTVQPQLWGSLIALIVAIGSPASAQGITRVQQADGSVRLYHDVRISLTGETLWIKSADHKGALEIVDGACSFVDELKRCLPYAVSLHQHGRTRAIALERGTVYFNLSGTPRRLHDSSQFLGPRDVLVAFNTVHGTYVTVQGRLDAVKP